MSTENMNIPTEKQIQEVLTGTSTPEIARIVAAWFATDEGAPTADMLADPSPYNTRLNTGLPPTPIANPGIASINAALYPESTGYYYYALDTATGQHRFFTNADEFNAFVATQNYE